MPGSRCVLLRGVRLPYAQVCLFDRPPEDYTINPPPHVIIDSCRKRKFPAPHYCKPLWFECDVIATRVFTRVNSFDYAYYMALPHNYFLDPDGALASMWRLGPDLHHDVGPHPFQLQFLFEVFIHGGNKWESDGTLITQGMYIDYLSLDPEWRLDDDVAFCLAFNSPNFSPCPDWIKLIFANRAVDCDGAAYEFPVSKDIFYSPGFRLDFSIGPVGFDYAEFQSLPLWGDYGLRGWDYHNQSAFNLRLLVRRGKKDFKVCWPESVFKKPRYAALVDGVSGQVISPPLEIY